MLTFLETLLSTAQLPSLRALYLAISLLFTKDFRRPDSDYRDAWMALDNVLSLPRYATLERIVVRFFVYDMLSEDEPLSPLGSEVVKSVLPKLSTRQHADFAPMPFPM